MPALSSTRPTRRLARQLARAEALCRERKARLTPLRREVLELLLSLGRPGGAYELLELLRARGHKGGPPTVYRALDFLQAQGLVHRIESSNAYLACTHPGESSHEMLLVCADCGEAVELEADHLAREVERNASRLGFELPVRPLEVVGTCARCRRGQA